MVDNVLDEATNKLSDPTDQGLDRLQMVLDELEDLTLDLCQQEFSDVYDSLCNKLTDGDQLSNDEWAIVDMMIVGPERFYLKHEDDLEQWKSELRDLFDLIDKLKKDGISDVTDYLELLARIREAGTVLPDLTKYYRAKERVKSFEEAKSGSVDNDQRQLLAELIQNKMDKKGI